MRPFLEQRVIWARDMVNGCTLEFQDQLPPKSREVFHRLALAIVAVLDGDDNAKQLHRYWMNKRPRR